MGNVIEQITKVKTENHTICVGLRRRIKHLSCGFDVEIEVGIDKSAVSPPNNDQTRIVTAS